MPMPYKSPAMDGPTPGICSSSEVGRGVAFEVGLEVSFEVCFKADIPVLVLMLDFEMWIFDQPQYIAFMIQHRCHADSITDIFNLGVGVGTD